MEGYILGGRNISESTFKNEFKQSHGSRSLREFEDIFRSNFVQESDFKKIKLMGANTVRLPFHHRLIEVKPSVYSSQGLAYLDKAFAWARNNGIKIILDLHAAPGSQNCDWHADSQGKALLWQNKLFRQRTVDLWGFLAQRFKDDEALLGYDVLNEPVLGKRSPLVLRNFYKKIIDAIRAVDRNNFIFLEGDVWAQRIDFLKELISDKIVVSIHAYHPLEYVFNFTPFGSFPGKINGCRWTAERLADLLRPYHKFSQKNKVDIFVGEFGINWRGGFWGEGRWLESIMNIFDQFEFGYTYWTYKAVAQYLFPDGLYQKIENSPYVNRQGPVFGWENYAGHWPRLRGELGAFFATSTFSPNTALLKILSKQFKKISEVGK